MVKLHVSVESSLAFAGYRGNTKTHFIIILQFIKSYPNAFNKTISWLYKGPEFMTCAVNILVSY